MHRYYEICLRSIKVCVRIEIALTKRNRINRVPFFCCCSSRCLTEFDIAYHHNVAVRRKKRLIVLMMLDNPAAELYNDDASDKAALRQYVRQYTYIDYAKDDWLDRLLYALPLRGLAQQQQGNEEQTAIFHETELQMQ